MDQHRKEIPESLQRCLYSPAYRIREGAHLAETQPQTLSRWFRGERPVVEGKPNRAALSYLQLVEGAFVASFRSLGVSLQDIRKARAYLSQVFEAEFPFAQLELKTDGFSIFKELDSPNDKLGFLIANRSGQEIWKALAAKRIHQFDYDEEYGLALRWYPRGHDVPILVDPQISFGAPILEDTGIATWALAARVRGGRTTRIYIV